MEIKIPKSFEQKFSKLFGEDYPKLINCLNIKPRKSIRVNTIKIPKENLIKRLKDRSWKLEPILWCSNGFFVETSEEISKTVEYFLGYYRIQEASSMIPPLVLEPKYNETILDMCAAPGSKTTQLTEMMKNKGMIIANDNSLKRLNALKINLQRAGVIDCVVNYMDGRNLWKTGLKFDKILLDAPCSGSGTIISSYSVLKMWSPFIVEKMSRLQKQLITSASKCLKENSSMVYSTCSLDPEENESVIDFAVRELGLRIEKIEINNLNYHKGIIEWNGKKFSEEIKNCVRIHPFDNNTEGFFICKLRF